LLLCTFCCFCAEACFVFCPPPPSIRMHPALNRGRLDKPPLWHALMNNPPALLVSSQLYAPFSFVLEFDLFGRMSLMLLSTGWSSHSSFPAPCDTAFTNPATQSCSPSYFHTKITYSFLDPFLSSLVSIALPSRFFTSRSLWEASRKVLHWFVAPVMNFPCQTHRR